MKTCLVNKSHGLTWETFCNGFENYLHMNYLSQLPLPLQIHSRGDSFGSYSQESNEKRFKIDQTIATVTTLISSNPSPVSSLDEGDGGHVFGDEIHSCMSSLDYFDDQSHVMSSASSDFSPSSSLDETEQIPNGRSAVGWYEFGRIR